MKKPGLWLGLALLAAFAGPLGAAQAQSTAASFKLNALNNSGETGAVTLTPVGNSQVRVVIEVANGSATPQPAHIHKGTCANLDPTPAFPLNNVVNGKSDTTVAVAMADLAKGSYAVNIHKSSTEVATYVSCGDLLMAATPPTPAPGGSTGGNIESGLLTVKLAELNNSGVYGGARITAAANGQTRVELALTGGGSAAMPAHIHKGTCAALNPTPAFPLTSVTGGASDTTVAISLADLANGGYAINVHKSAAEIGVYVACGNIEAPPPAPTPAPGTGGLGGATGGPGMPTTGHPAEFGAWLLLGLALLLAGLRLVPRRA